MAMAAAQEGGSPPVLLSSCRTPARIAGAEKLPKLTQAPRGARRHAVNDWRVQPPAHRTFLAWQLRLAGSLELVAAVASLPNTGQGYSLPST
jgi:hypothetical protein